MMLRVAFMIKNSLKDGEITAPTARPKESNPWVPRFFPE